MSTTKPELTEPKKEELVKSYGELMQRYNEIIVELEHLRKQLFVPNHTTKPTTGKEL